MSEHRLPVAYSIIDTNALETLVASLYGWSHVGCQLIKGTMRDVYEVVAEAQHAILCVYRHGERTHDEIAAELAIMRHLYAQGVAAPLPVAMLDGKTLFALTQPEGVRYAVMISFVDGTPIGRQITPDTAEAVGALLGDGHFVLRQLPDDLARPTINYAQAMDDAIRAFAAAAPRRYRDTYEMKGWYVSLVPQIARLTRENAAYGMTHGDIIPSNILRQDTGLALLDFDLCAYGWQMFDVASFLVEVAYWNMGDDVRAAFLRGYESRRRLSEIERALLPAFQAMRGIISLGTPARFINTWGRGYFADPIIDKQLQLIRLSIGELPS
jgi:Ser/Thr protein kinase RdoA (MazF antagonist)